MVIFTISLDPEPDLPPLTQIISDLGGSRSGSTTLLISIGESKKR
jgi:hypothetical protein